MGIYILFEKENIDTGKMEGELLLSILSSLAESESHSISENEIWSIQKRFRNGTFKISYPLQIFLWIITSKNESSYLFGERTIEKNWVCG